MWEPIHRLYGYLSDLDNQTLILKLSEEVGEVSEAYIGMNGLNPRKGVCRSRDDVLAELSDVIITAAVAMCGMTEGDPGQAQAHLDKRLNTITERVGLP